MTNRRDLMLGALPGFALFALLTEARAAVPLDSKLPARRWVMRQDELARGLARGTLSPTQWHDAVNALASEGRCLRTCF